MTPSKSKRSALPALLLALAGVTWMYFSATGEVENPWEPFRTEQEATQIDAAAELERESLAGRRTGVVERTDFQGSGVLGEGALAQTENALKPVRVRAELRIEKDQINFTPKNVEGWVVVVQTWETVTTPRFESIADENGVAEFEFPGDVHIDWVSCLPPANSGYGLSFIEEHEDLQAGDDYLAVLMLEPSRTAFGTVVDQNEKPISGAIVHAYDRDQTYQLSNWTLGFLQTTTNGQGRFEFSQLREGNWVFAVQPSDWLMVSPLHGNQQESQGVAIFDQDATGPIDAGILQCVPLSTVEVLVTGLDGKPIPGAILFVEPLSYDASYLIPTEPDLEKMEDRARERTEELINVGDYRESFVADETGHVTLRLIAGRWMTWTNSLPGMDPNEMKLPNLPFHTQESALTYRLPVRTLTLSGTVSGSDGSLPLAEVRFAWKGKDYEEYFEMVTDAKGQFEFTGTFAEGGYEVRAWPDTPGWLPQQWDFSMEDLREPLDLVLEPGATLSMRFTNMKEAPNSAPYGFIQLESWTPLEKGPVDLEAYWWKAKQGLKMHIVPDRSLSISGLAPGSYEVSLTLPQPDYHARSGTKPDMYERQRWTIKTQQDTHTLVIGE